MDDTITIACRSSIFMAQGMLGAVGVRRVWAGAGLQRAVYRGWGILRGFPQSLLLMTKRCWQLVFTVWVFLTSYSVYTANTEKTIFIVRQHAMHPERDIVMANLSVCPSVCPMTVLCLTEWRC